MNINISLKHTIEFFKFAKERSKLFDDYEFELQIEYFADLRSRDKVSSDDLMALLDVVDFWEFWLNSVSALKKYTTMVVEIACYAHVLEEFNASAKIKGDN